MIQMHYFDKDSALIGSRLAFRFVSKQNQGRILRTMGILQTAVSKLINPDISGTLFAVFRKPPFLGHTS